MHGGSKAARYRSEDGERRGWKCFDCLWKTRRNSFSGQLAASETFSTGTVLGQNRTLRYISGQKNKKRTKKRKYNKAISLKKKNVLTWQKSNTTSLLRLHSACALSSVGKTGKKNIKKTQNQFTINHSLSLALCSSATSAVSFCSGC